MTALARDNRNPVAVIIPQYKRPPSSAWGRLEAGQCLKLMQRGKIVQEDDITFSVPWYTRARGHICHLLHIL